VVFYTSLEAAAGHEAPGSREWLGSSAVSARSWAFALRRPPPGDWGGVASLRAGPFFTKATKEQPEQTQSKSKAAKTKSLQDLFFMRVFLRSAASCFSRSSCLQGCVVFFTKLLPEGVDWVHSDTFGVMFDGNKAHEVVQITQEFFFPHPPLA